MNKWLRIAVIIIALIVMIICGYKLFQTIHAYKVADNSYETTAGQYVKKKTPEQTTVSRDFVGENLTSADSDVAADSTDSDDIVYHYSEEGAFDWSGYADPAPIEVDFETLLIENDDVKGWLFSEDSPINYPVLKGESNETYLHHLPDGTYNFSGSLFIENNNHDDLSDINTIIYGHSMKNGSMFGTIINYAKQEYYDEHPVLWYLTPNGDFRLDPVMGLVIPADIDLYDIYYDLESYRELLGKYIDKSTFDSGLTMEDIDQAIMLSTCSHAYDDARYVLICRLVPCRPDTVVD